MDAVRIPSTHTDSIVSICVQPELHLLVSGGEDARIVFVDTVTCDGVGSIAFKSKNNVGDEDIISAVVASPVEKHRLFAAHGTKVMDMDLRKGYGEPCIVNSIHVSKEEINSLSIDCNGTTLAAGDDSGEIQLLPTSSACSATQEWEREKCDNGKISHRISNKHNTLRRGHTNICSSVVFRPNNRSELMSGGLDCKLIKWSTSAYRPIQTWNMGLAGNPTQICNPPMVNDICVPQVDKDDRRNRLVAVARGDGCIALYDADCTPPSDKHSYRKSRKSKSRDKRKAAVQGNMIDPNSDKNESENDGESLGHGMVWYSGPETGGHSAGVNSIAFLPDYSHELKLISCANDRKISLWQLENINQDEDLPLHPICCIQNKSKVNILTTAVEDGRLKAFAGDIDGNLLGLGFR